MRTHFCVSRMHTGEAWHRRSRGVGFYVRAHRVRRAQADTPTWAGLSASQRCEITLIRQEMRKRIDGHEIGRSFAKIVPKLEKTGRTSAGFAHSRLSRTTYCYPMSTLRRPSRPAGTESEMFARPVPPVLPATPVLVDASGRRQRRVRLAVRVAVVCLLGYLALAVVLLLIRPGLVPLGLPGLNPSTHQPAHKTPRPSPAGKGPTSTPDSVGPPSPRTTISPTVSTRPSVPPSAANHGATTKTTHANSSPAKHTHGRSSRSTQSTSPSHEHLSSHATDHSAPHTPPGQAKKTEPSNETAQAHHKAAS